MLLTRPIFVLGKAGSRIDFVSGWLGSLPGFVDGQWRIDLASGRSYTYGSIIREFDSIDLGEKTLTTLLADHNIAIDAQAPSRFAVSLHGRNFDKKTTDTDRKNSTILKINTVHADQNKIFWEFLVKTYLSFDTRSHAWSTGEHYNIDRLVTTHSNDNLRQKAVLNVIAQRHKYGEIDIGQIPHIEIDYRDILDHNGSYILAEKLNLDLDQKYHTLWKNNLEFAKAPDRVYCFSRWWEFNQLFPQ